MRICSIITPKLLIFLYFFSISIGAQIEHRAGDYKGNYDKNYRTSSLSLDYREKNKKPFDLIKNATSQLGLPPLPAHRQNLITETRVKLGRKLFFDRRLSLNNTFSCAICHIPEQGFSSNELATSVGIEGRTVRRNAPTILNVAYMNRLFHDAREDKLELQVWTPLLTKNEMANPSFASVINKIKSLKEYDGLFEEAFAGEGASVVSIGQALAAYQLTLNSANSRFDQWFYGDNAAALNDKEEAGFAIFLGKGRCSTCHLLDKEAAIFHDNQLHNTGIGYAASMHTKGDYVSVQVSPGVFVEVEQKIVDQVSEPIANDLGLYEITQDPKDRWKYKTSTLRNIALTAPYMHNGSLSTLKEVVAFYNKGGEKNPVLSPLIKPLALNQIEIDALVAFLGTLTGSNVDNLVEDAFTEKIGEVIE